MENKPAMKEPTGFPTWPLGHERAIALASCSDLREALTLLLDAATDIPGIDSGGVYVVTAEGDVDLVAHKGLSLRFVERTTHFGPESPNAQIVATGVPLFSVRESLRDPVMTDEGLLAVASVPVVRDGRSIAALNLASRTVDEFSDQMRSLLAGLAAEVGAVLSRIQAEEALRTSQENLRQVFNRVDDCLFILDMQGTILHVNVATCRVLERTMEELVGTSVLAVHPSDRSADVLRVVHAMLAGDQTVCVIPLVAASGRYVPVETRVAMGEWNGQPALIGTSRDVTERHRMDQELRQSEARLKMVLEHSHVAAYRRDVQADRYDYMSPVIERVVGYSHAEFSGMSFGRLMSLVHPEDAASVEAAFSTDACTDLDRCSVEYRFMAPDGQYRWISDRFETHRESDGAPVFRTGTVQDITASRMAEQALAASETKYRAIFENELTAIILVDADTHEIADANHTCLQLYGYSMEELQGQSAELLSAEADATDMAMREARSGAGVVVPLRWHRKRSGLVFPVRIFAGPFTWGTRPMIFALIHDVSDRVQAKEALEASERRYRATFEASRDALVVLDEGGIVDCNRAASELFDLDRSALLGCRLANLSPEYQVGGVASAEALQHRISAAADEQLDSFPWVCSRGDGTTFDAEIQISRMELLGRPIMLARLRDVTARNRDQRQLRESEARYRRLAEENERLMLQAQQDAASRARLLHEVNHRVKNNLAAIMGVLDLERAAGEDVAARTEGQLLDDLANRVHAMSVAHGELSASSWKPVVLSTLVSKVVNTAHATVAAGWKAPAQIEDSSVQVPAKQATALALILNELATNAGKHASTDQGLRVGVRIGGDEHEAWVEFRDNGPGYPEEVLQGRRSNVGMDLVRMLSMMDLRGRLELRNDGGAVARITFPFA